MRLGRQQIGADIPSTNPLPPNLTCFIDATVTSVNRMLSLFPPRTPTPRVDVRRADLGGTPPVGTVAGMDRAHLQNPQLRATKNVPTQMNATPIIRDVLIASPNQK